MSAPLPHVILDCVFNDALDAFAVLLAGGAECRDFLFVETDGNMQKYIFIVWGGIFVFLYAL